MTVMALRSKTRRWQGGGTLLGIAFGIFVGVLISFGVVWYLNRAPLPFVEKVTKHEQKENGAKGPVALPGKPGDKPVEPRKFEFYEILEGRKQAVPGAAPPPAAVPAPGTEAVPAATAPATPVGGLYLQVGAFQKAADAEKLKAQLAMLGFEAGVLPVEVPDKGLMHRVRVGPFASPEEVNRARTQLSQQGVSATVVRAKE